MSACPHCQRTEEQVKIGRNRSGSQRYLCKVCQRKYTPEPKEHGYSQAVRQEAVKLYVDGMNYRRIGRTLGVDKQTVANWASSYANSLPDRPPLPAAPLDTNELDEVFTFIGDKKMKPTSSPT
ncbi:MAG: IS1 family transposase [Anaerolineae bacterium]|nr:IS1 family transposase [Anaerolineae bacterium]